MLHRHQRALPPNRGADANFESYFLMGTIASRPMKNARPASPVFLVDGVPGYEPLDLTPASNALRDRFIA